ncbi:hypothetical protein DSUL_90102 [Desulfovibrionales bacterium]
MANVVLRLLFREQQKYMWTSGHSTLVYYIFLLAAACMTTHSCREGICYLPVAISIVDILSLVSLLYWQPCSKDIF